ncbi:MAG: DNA polymerase III subunit delta' [Candidatus Limivivens sp.]|nr:DNA polymerase III subunit delta' [Candidatus Limivivens sp.]
MSGFEKIMGHTQAITHLKNAIEQNKVSHAYIFNGEKGCGKKMLALEFARMLQCQEKDRPCGKCRSCLQAESGNHPDIIRVTHEKPGSIGVEDIREQLIGDVQIKPYSSPYKVYIVPDAEKMTVQAQNALLKTIEEPPAYAVILLLTTNASLFLPTILSRCVMIAMKPVADEQVRQYLMEHVQIPDYQADICVAFAQGNIGKAVQLASSETFQEIKTAALNLAMHIPDMEISEINQNVKDVSVFKMEIQDYLDLLAVWYRDALYFKATKDVNGMVFKEQINTIVDQTRKASYEGISRILDALQKAKTRLSANVNFDLTMELLFLTIKENLG